MSSAEAPVFEALIVPHRSLSRRGTKFLVGGLAAATALVGIRFWLWGAWPVLAFTVVEVPLLVVMLALNLRRARASELIMLDSSELTVIRTDPSGRRKRDSLPAAWLRVDLEATKGIPRVMLSSHGRGCEVGAFLHEPERISLFESLNAALYRAKHPSFENPQLQVDASATEGDAVP